jgi:hypothetical protein
MRTFPSRLSPPHRRALVILAIAAAAVTAVTLTGPLGVGGTKAGIVAQAVAQDAPACTTGYQPSPGFSLDVCLAQNGNTVIPSAVVHQLGAYSSCTLALEIWDDVESPYTPARTARSLCTPSPG